MTNAIFQGKSDAGSPSVRLDSDRERLCLRLCALGLGVMAGVCVGFPALASTTVVDPPARAVASYASESKGVVNARGLSSARDNAKRMRLKGRGAVLIIR